MIIIVVSIISYILIVKGVCLKMIVMLSYDDLIIYMCVYDCIFFLFLYLYNSPNTCALDMAI